MIKQIIERFSLLLFANILVIFVLMFIGGVVLHIIMPMFGMHPYQLNVSDLIWAIILGFGGSFLSLLINQWVIKRQYDLLCIDDPVNNIEKFIVQCVGGLAKDNGIQHPSVWVYDDIEPNAFTTGIAKNKSMIAISSGMINLLNENELQSVIAHEFGHIVHGDMVTITLLQGVLNTFSVFASAYLARSVYQQSYILGFIVSILSQMFLSFLAMIPIAFYSRKREIEADAFSSMVFGSKSMIHALEKIEHESRLLIIGDIDNLDLGMGVMNKDSLATAKICSITAIISNVKKSWWRSLFATHPSTKERVASLMAKVD